MRGGYEFVAVLDPSGSFGAARQPLASSGRGGAPSARRPHSVRWPRGVGDPRSEVKEEGWAKPGPGDMSGGGHPPRVAREVLAHARTGARPKLESGTGGMRCSS
jgi:hypothetical protein